ncbi:MAG: PEP-CTERM sorting domain-containing protein [Candidatus Hydrogenedentes bacterium]|nr:PEP-CTERM sorting domain-containing protein [Candidatus Hydrogenedentota bacterium]
MLAIATFAGNASAIVVDGSWSDWFSYGGTNFNDWDQAAASGSLLSSSYRFMDDPDNDAFGGQPYDIEQLFYYYDDADSNALSGGVLYIGMVTGYDPANTLYSAGDMFVDLGATGSYSIAVATGTVDTLGNPDPRFGSAWINAGWDETTDGVTTILTSSNPYRILEGAGGVIEYGTGPAAGLTSTVAWGLNQDASGARNFLEIAIDLDGTFEEQIDNGLGDGGLGLHWTMQCGNDVINVVDNVPLAPVPEPTTMVLLGMGVLGMALRARRPVC